MPTTPSISIFSGRTHKCNRDHSLTDHRPVFQSVYTPSVLPVYVCVCYPRRHICHAMPCHAHPSHLESCALPCLFFPPRSTSPPQVRGILSVPDRPLSCLVSSVCPFFVGKDLQTESLTDGCVGALGFSDMSEYARQTDHSGGGGASPNPYRCLKKVKRKKRKGPYHLTITEPPPGRWYTTKDKRRRKSASLQGIKIVLALFCAETQGG